MSGGTQKKLTLEGFMKKLFLIVLVSFLNIYAQKCGDAISLEGNWFTGYKYSYHCSEYNKVAGLFTITNEFNNIISLNPKAKSELNVALAYSDFGLAIGCIGGAIIGWHLADLTYGKKVDNWVWPTAIGLMGVGITLDIIGTNHMLKSIKIFNKF